MSAAAPLPRSERARPVAFFELFRDLVREHGFEPLAVEGALPTDLRGTLYRNGPGLFGQFGRPYDHPFEGDGAVSAVRLSGGRAEGAVRLVASRGLAEERAAGRILYGTSAPRLRRLWNLHGKRRDKNVANTNVIAWQGRLFALMEAGKPTELSPEDLETLGETDLGGSIPGAFSAHPHRIASRRASYNFGLRYGRTCWLDLYELPDAGPARRLGSMPLARPLLMHDFVATETHLVFFAAPSEINVKSVLLASGGFRELLRWRPERGTEIIAVPIDRPEEPVRFTVDAFFQWHFANAFDRGRGLVVDYVRYPDLSSFTALAARDHDIPPGVLHRAVVDPARGTLTSEPSSDHEVEFPRVHPEREGVPCRYTFVTLAGARGIGCFDHETGTMEALELPASQLCSEPVFAPRPGGTGERDGYVLCHLYDGAREQTGVAVIDAARLGDGPVAIAWFDHPLPVSFHGNWVAGPQA